MGFSYSLVLSIHIIVGMSVIGLVLLQHGKGADMGAAFGSGASGSLFGASGSANFMSRLTAGLAAVSAAPASRWPAPVRPLTPLAGRLMYGPTGPTRLARSATRVQAYPCW